MRIGLLTNLYPPDVLGGYELLAADVAAGLRDRGHTVHVLTSGDGSFEADVYRGLKMYRGFGEEARRDRFRQWATSHSNRHAVRRFVERFGRPDALLVMSLRRVGLAPLRAFSSARVPFVLTINDDWPVAFVPSDGVGRGGALARILDRSPLAKHTWRGVVVRRAVYLTDAIRRHVTSAGAPLPPGVVQPQGVDLSAFPARPFRPMRSPLSLLFVGRLHPTKGPDLAIRALFELAKRGVPSTLRIAGEPFEAAYGEQLRSLAESLGVANQIEWLGQLPRATLSKVYRAADLLLFVTRCTHEAQGLTYMEAMASGIPVVASAVGGAKEVLQAACGVRLVPNEDAEGIASAVIELAGSAEKQRHAVEQGLEFLKNRLSLDRYVERIEHELEAVRDG